MPLILTERNRQQANKCNEGTSKTKGRTQNNRR